MIRLSFNISTISEIWILLFYLVFSYPSGKSIIPYLPCYQGLAVDDYGFPLDAADMGHSRLSLNRGKNLTDPGLLGSRRASKRIGSFLFPFQ